MKWIQEEWYQRFFLSKPEIFLVLCIEAIMKHSSMAWLFHNSFWRIQWKTYFHVELHDEVLSCIIVHLMIFLLTTFEIFVNVNSFFLLLLTIWKYSNTGEIYGRFSVQMKIIEGSSWISLEEKTWTICEYPSIPGCPLNYPLVSSAKHFTKCKSIKEADVGLLQVLSPAQLC